MEVGAKEEKVREREGERVCSTWGKGPRRDKTKYKINKTTI